MLSPSAVQALTATGGKKRKGNFFERGHLLMFF